MRQAIVDGLRNSVVDFSAASGITRHQVMDLVLITQYFDYLSEVGGGKFSHKPADAPGETMFIYHNPAATAELKGIMKGILSDREREAEGKGG